MKIQRVVCSGYTGDGQDILLTQVTEGGKIQAVSGLRHGENPSFCCLMEGRVYAAAEQPEGASVTAYQLERGELLPQGRMELPGRRGLCHLAAIGGVLYGSCYESGHYFALDAGLTRVLWEYLPDGAPRAHWAEEIGGALYLADLGNDRVYLFALRAGLPEGAPEIFRLPPGSGPRQPLPLPGGGFAVVCELDGMLRCFQGDGQCYAALPASRAPGRNAPGGACWMGDAILVGNRGPNTVSAFHILPEGLAFVGEWPAGNWPRHLACLEGGLLLAACSRDDALWLYRWDGRTLDKLDELPLHQASCALPLP